MNNNSGVDSTERCREELKKLCGKEQLYFVQRCNKALEMAVFIAVSKLANPLSAKLLIQDEGGWMTYSNLASKNKLECIKVPTENGKMNITELNSILKKGEGNAIVLLHSMTGYSYMEDSKKVLETARKYGCIMINDVCGSIGTSQCKYGDIIVCSFGKAKPLSIGKEGAAGGFLAGSEVYIAKYASMLKANEESVLKSEVIDFNVLHSRINAIQSIRDKWKTTAFKIKTDLQNMGFDVLNPEDGGINVLAGYSSETEKERLINYCTEHNIEYTLCPRYIRTNRKAVCLEVKRT